MSDHKSGNPAVGKLFSEVYGELHSLAQRYMEQERPDHTLQPTALINEAFLRLAEQRKTWRNRSELIGVAEQAMRRVLVDHARRCRRQKRQSPGRRVPMLETISVGAKQPVDIVALDHALDELESFDADRAQLVMLRYFGGCTIKEAAEVLGVSVATAHRYWRSARAWLYRHLKDDGRQDASGTSDE